MLFDESQRLIHNQVVRIGLAVQFDLFQVMPQMVRVIVVGLALAVVAEELIEPLMHRVAFGTGGSQAPLAERPGGIAGLFEQLRQRDGLGGNRLFGLRV